MSDQQKTERRSYRKSTYGVTTNQVFSKIEENPRNVFGRKVVEMMAQKGYSLADMLKWTGLYQNRFFRILLDEERSLSSDPELIYRLADKLGVGPAELLALYFQSKERYYSPAYRGPYKMGEYLTEALAPIVASFVTLWETLVHAPNQEEKKREEQLVRATDLLEAFYQLDTGQQTTLLQMATALAKQPGKPIEVDPAVRAVSSVGEVEEKKPTVSPRKRAKKQKPEE